MKKIKEGDMVTVYSLQQVAEGKFPANAREISLIYDLIRQELGQSQAIVGAVLGGSVVSNSHSLASDIDGLIVVDDKDINGAWKVLWNIFHVAAEHYVPLDLAVVRQSVAYSPLQPVSAGYARALGTAAKQGGVIKQNPLEMLGSHPFDLRADTINYLGRKLAKFEAWMAGSHQLPGERSLFLSEVLSTPVHLGRRILDLRGVELSTGTAAEVSQALSRIVPALSMTLQQLASAKQDYATSLLVERQASERGSFNRLRYLQALDAVHRRAGLAYTFCVHTGKIIGALP